MPKRIPTPPPSDDEPRYLTVVYPYAISGTCNMELTKDRQDFACWVASCIDKDAFFAIFHKPSVSLFVFNLAFPTGIHQCRVADDMVPPFNRHEVWSSLKSTEIMRTLTVFSVNIAGPNFSTSRQRKRAGGSRKSFTAHTTPGGSCRKTVRLAYGIYCVAVGGGTKFFAFVT